MKTITVEWLKGTSVVDEFRLLYGKESCKLSANNVLKWIEAFPSTAKDDLTWLTEQFILGLSDYDLHALEVKLGLNNLGWWNTKYITSAVIQLPYNRLAKAIEEIAQKSSTI